jgi:hypothetical protein
MSSTDGTAAEFVATRHVQIVQLLAYYRLPAAYSPREFAETGGLMSYGTNIGDAWRQAGAGCTLKGAKPTDLPVAQPSKFELAVHYVAGGGLISYGPDFLDQYQRNGRRALFAAARQSKFRQPLLDILVLRLPRPIVSCVESARARW